MTGVDLKRRLASEAIGTALLSATVIGSGIMATSLTADPALALLANTVATAAVLVVLITIFAPVSGAHFNPAVSTVLALSGQLRWRMAGAYAGAQLAGGVAGTLVAHAMFAQPLWQFSARVRTGPAQWLSEAVATFGLVLVILMVPRPLRRWTGGLVGLYIAAAYWFTASTSFANPAVAVARSLTDTFAGIRLTDLPGFVAAEMAGAVAAALLCRWLLAPAAQVPAKP